MKELATIALKGLKGRTTRTVITVAAIVIGISAVVLLISISKGFEASVKALFEEFGSDTIMVMGGSGITSLMYAPMPLTEEDLKAVQRVPGVDYATGVYAKTLPVEYRGVEKAVVVYGMEPRALETLYGKIIETYIEEGRVFRRDGAREAILGYSVAHDLFGDDVKVGHTIEINGVKFRVVGVLRRIGDSADDLSITVPSTSFEEVAGKPGYVMIVAKLKEGSDPAEVGEKIRRELKRRRGTEDFTVQTSEDLMNQINSILAVIGAIVLAIAGISLFVGGVEIMNTMYMSVAERTREIGIMKAVGATRTQIMTIFLLEAGLIGVVGGIIGEGLAVGLSVLVEKSIQGALGMTYYHVSLDPLLLVGAAAFSFLMGVVAGYLPARRAAELDPAVTLRYE